LQGLNVIGLFVVIVICWNMQKQPWCQHGTFEIVTLRSCILLFQPWNKLGDFFAHGLRWDHFFVLCVIFWPLRHEISPITNKDFKCLLIIDSFIGIEDRVNNKLRSLILVIISQWSSIILASFLVIEILPCNHTLTSNSWKYG